MENASKALIIAGSILVSIVIITLGVMIVNNVRDTINSNSNLSAQEVESYNSEFQAYEGVRSGTQVRALLNTVASHNRVQTDDTRKIKIVTTKPTGDVTIGSSWSLGDTEKPEYYLSGAGAVKAGYTYDVSMHYDKNSGLIIEIAIVVKN